MDGWMDGSADGHIDREIGQRDSKRSISHNLSSTAEMKGGSFPLMFLLERLGTTPSKGSS